MMKKYLSIFVLSFLFLSTNNALAVYNASDVIGQRDGSNLPSFTTSAVNNGGSVSARGLSSEARAIKLDTTHHRLFVADRGSNRVLVYNLDSNNELVDTDADNVFGQVDLNSSASSCTTATGLNGPSGVEYDDTNNRLFVAMTNSAGTFSRVVVYDLSSGITDGMAAVNVLGQADLTTCNARVNTANNVYFPFDMKYDGSTGLLYVADLARNRVLAFDARPAGAAAITVCGVTTTGIVNNMNASCVIGQPNFTTVSSGNTDAKMNGTLGLAIDSTNHRLFVSEYAANRIKVFDISSLVDGSGANGMSASYVLGQTDFATATSGTTQSKLSWPGGLSFDSTTGLLYVSDEVNHRVMIYDVSGTLSNGMNATYVLGADDFTTINSGATASTMGSVFGNVFNPSTKNLFAIDVTNSRILVFKPTITITTSELKDTLKKKLNTLPLDVTGFQETASLALVGGALPDGLEISGTSLVGRPKEVGTFNFTIQAIDTGIHGIFNSLENADYSLVVKNPEISGSRPSSFSESAIISTVPVVQTPVTVEPKTCNTFTMPIKSKGLNDKGEVKAWQLFLNSQESENLSVDGGYGPLTKNAIIKFQSKYKLGSDGIVGPITREKANSIKICN